MDKYYIIGQAGTCCAEEEDIAPTSRRPTKKPLAKSTHYKYNTLEEAIEAATCRARRDEEDFVVYEAIKVIQLEKAPIKVEDIE